VPNNTVPRPHHTTNYTRLYGTMMRPDTPGGGAPKASSLIQRVACASPPPNAARLTPVLTLALKLLPGEAEALQLAGALGGAQRFARARVEELPDLDEQGARAQVLVPPDQERAAAREQELTTTALCPEAVRVAVLADPRAPTPQ